jgi:hypothetical protein
VALELSFGGVLNNNNLSNMARLSFSQSNIGSTILNNSLTQNHGSFIVHVGVRLACNCNGLSHVAESLWLVFGCSGSRRVDSHCEDSELCHCGVSSNSWQEFCNNENEYTRAGVIDTKCFVVVTGKNKLSDSIGITTLSGGSGGGIIVGIKTGRTQWVS